MICETRTIDTVLVFHCSAERERFRSIYFKFDERECFQLLCFKFAARGNICFPARHCCYIKVQKQYVYFPCGRAIISDMISDVNSDVISDGISDVNSSVTSEVSPKRIRYRGNKSLRGFL